jgi:SHS2 domain-containing protein
VPAPRVRSIDHTADVGLQVEADGPAAAFAAVAEAMIGIMVTRSQIEPRESWSVGVEAAGWEDLLVTWLEEILYLFEMEGRVPHRITMAEITSNHLAATVQGERLDRTRHEVGVQIKAVTYHQLRAEETDKGFEIQVIFDI